MKTHLPACIRWSADFVVAVETTFACQYYKFLSTSLSPLELALSPMEKFAAPAICIRVLCIQNVYMFALEPGMYACLARLRLLIINSNKTNLETFPFCARVTSTKSPEAKKIIAINQNSSNCSGFIGYGHQIHMNGTGRWSCITKKK